jgi:hydrogenase maturation protease
VAGLGSPHGDDQVGWWIVEMLGRRHDLPAQLVKVHEATQLLDHAVNCERLIVVDGCRSGSPLGSITRLNWPDERIAQQHSHSTHGVGLCDALLLAARLDRMPSHVEIFGVEISQWEPGSRPSWEVLLVLPELENMIVEELTKGVACTSDH